MTAAGPGGGFRRHVGRRVPQAVEGGGSPFPVRLPAMMQHWESVAFLHWSYPVAAVQHLLPPGLRVDAYQGRAWVGLIPFNVRARPPGLPGLPPLTHFPETNVRTYVIGPGSDPGIWFFSLDITRLAGVMAGRLLYHLPYQWSSMRLTRDGDTVRYSARRRTPPTGTSSLVDVQVGSRIDEGERGDLDHFLLARFTMYGYSGRRLLVARAHHGPWPVHHASLVLCEDRLVPAAGLPAPRSEPVVHWSPGVLARIGFPGPAAPPGGLAEGEEG